MLRFLGNVRDRLEHRFPFIGAVHVARSQRASLQVAVLIEHEKRMVARATDVSFTSSYPASLPKTD